MKNLNKNIKTIKNNDDIRIIMYNFREIFDLNIFSEKLYFWMFINDFKVESERILKSINNNKIKDDFQYLDIVKKCFITVVCNNKQLLDYIFSWCEIKNKSEIRFKKNKLLLEIKY